MIPPEAVCSIVTTFFMVASAIAELTFYVAATAAAYKILRSKK